MSKFIITRCWSYWSFVSGFKKEELEKRISIDSQRLSGGAVHGLKGVKANVFEYPKNLILLFRKLAMWAETGLYFFLSIL